MANFVVLSTLTADPEALAPHREAHLAYLAGLKEHGKLLIGGRFGDGRGGMYILSTTDEAEARMLAEADPYHRKGLRSFVVRAWERRL